MRNGYVRDALWEDVSTVALDMRPADVAEIKAAGGITPGEALYGGLLQSAFGGRTKTLCLNSGKPVAMLGVAPSGKADAGLIWLLAANGVQEIQTMFVRDSHKYIAEVSQGYRVVYNYTDARNTLHHKWLKWCGFTIIKRHERWGYESKPFLEFCKIVE